MLTGPAADQLALHGVPVQTRNLGLTLVSVMWVKPNEREVPEELMEFSRAKANFYLAAQHGLEATITWLDNRQLNVSSLILNKLIAESRCGLEQLGIDKTDIDEYLEIIAERARSRQNGSSWQMQYIRKYGRDMQRLAEQYWENQRSESPVHEWAI